MKIRYLLPKVKNRIRGKINNSWRYYPVDKFFLLSIGKVPAKKELISRLEAMLGNINQATLSSVDKSITDEIVFFANKTLIHEFNYLGSGWTEINPIVWHTDFKSGFTWPIVFCNDVKRYTKTGADIKLPWDLSRGHHLLWLGEAYLLTSEEKYAKEVVDEISDWIDKNPFAYGVNWTCSMDVAIRAVSWMYAISFIKDSETLTDVIADKVYKALFLHGKFIRTHLEKRYPWSNNHYFSNLVGLLYLGRLFSNHGYGRRWGKFAIKEFYAEIRAQILPSGVHYEKSVSYHRLMVELTSYSIAMLRRSGKIIPNDITDIVEKMYDYVEVYQKPNKKAPLLEDNDNGRFLPFSYGDFREHGYLLDSESIDSKLAFAGLPFPYKKKRQNKNIVYQDANIAFLKNETAYLLFNNCGYSRNVSATQKNIGSHTHNDQLSFELNLYGKDIIIDPGTYVYTSSIDERNQFRSTLKHNTIIVDGEEQNILSTSNAFNLVRNVVIDAIEQKGNSFKGSYHTIQGDLYHERIIHLEDESLLITDKLTKKGENHQGIMSFHLDEGVLSNINDGVVVITALNVAIKMIVNSDGTMEITERSDTISPSYGILKKSNTIEIHFEFKEQTEITTTIKWKEMN